MTARNPYGVYASINDFIDKCRICLKNYSDMVDIFASGFSSQIMEIANIKISDNDKLPKKMCQDCGIQLRELHKFQCLVKDSDNYLRALLNAESILDPSTENLGLKSVKKQKRKMHGRVLRFKSSQESKENLKNDKMYLILVTEASNNMSQNEICIKDLDVENENPELTNICKSLIKNQSGDNSHIDDNKSLCLKTGIDVIKGNDKGEIYNVNLCIYNCSECEDSFELKELLIEHLRNYHKTEVLSSSYSYLCPVCYKSESDKNLFLNHLLDHRKYGFLFSKVQNSCNSIPLTKVETEIFEVAKIIDELVVRNKIFKINTNHYKCCSCKRIVSSISVDEHLKMCYSNLKDCDLSHSVKYTCPACSKSWNNDVESANLHLSSHRRDNVFFIKVDDSGEPIDLREEDIAFTLFEDAVDMLSFDNGVTEEFPRCDDSKKIFKVPDLFSCLICHYEDESIVSLTEHYLKMHQEVAMTTAELTCPVCSRHFKFIYETDAYFEHLKNHKTEGVLFLRTDKDGSVLKKSSDNCGLYTDLNDLFHGKVRCLELEFIGDVHVAEIFVSRPVESPHSERKEYVSTEEVAKADVSEVDRSNREYVCEKCGRKCLGRGNYKRHFKTHVEKKRLSSGLKRPSCSVCKKTFSNRTSLNEHRKHHAVEEIDGSDGETDRKICEICGRRLSNNASLAKHRRLHLSNKESSLFKCKICERGFRKELALNRHVSHHLNPNYFECEICKLPLPSSASLQRHKLWHEGSSNTHDCKVCKLSFLTRDRLTAHQTHTGHHQDRKRFECNVCHERFFVGREFSQHIKIHPKYKMSECSLCGKRLSTMQSLMLHLSRHFESNSILCPHCGKQFFEERNYHRHLLTHKGVKPFSCDFDGCKKSFYTYFELNRHKKYHNNTRDFNCSYCPKSFHEANHLKVHVRTHTGERPYTCPHCNKGFVTRTRCKQHINLIHQGVGCDLIQSNISKKVAVFEALETVS